MAYELKYGQSLKQGDEDEEQRNSLFGAAANATAATAAQPTAGAGAAQPGGSGRFVNFERYLNANLGSADATAGKIEHDVNNTAGMADAQIKDATKAQGGRIADNAMTGIDPTKATDAQLQTWSQTPWKDPGAITQTGEFGNAVKSVTQANQQLAATGTQEGLQGLLKDQNKGADTYTQGMNRLDGALVGGVEGGRFAALRKQYSNLDQMLTGAVTNDEAMRAQGALDAGTNAQAAAGELDSRKQAKQLADDQAADAASTKQVADDDLWWKETSGSIPIELRQWLDMPESGTDETKRRVFDAKYGEGAYDRYRRIQNRQRTSGQKDQTTHDANPNPSPKPPPGG